MCQSELLMAVENIFSGKTQTNKQKNHVIVFNALSNFIPKNLNKKWHTFWINWFLFNNKKLN